MYNEKYIEWQQLWQVYNKQASMSSKSKGIVFDTKLKMEHMKLTSYSCMTSTSIAVYLHIHVCIQHLTGIEQTSF